MRQAESCSDAGQESSTTIKPLATLWGHGYPRHSWQLHLCTLFGFFQMGESATYGMRQSSLQPICPQIQCFHSHLPVINSLLLQCDDYDPWAVTWDPCAINTAMHFYQFTTHTDIIPGVDALSIRHGALCISCIVYHGYKETAEYTWNWYQALYLNLQVPSASNICCVQK